MSVRVGAYRWVAVCVGTRRNASRGARRVRGGRRACMGCGWGWSRWNRVGAHRQGWGTSGGAGIRRGTCGARRQRVEKGWDVRWGHGARTGAVAARREGTVRARGAGGAWLRVGRAGGACDAWNGADHVRGGCCASLGGRARGWGSSGVEAQGGWRWDVWAALGHLGGAGARPKGSERRGAVWCDGGLLRGLGHVGKGRGGLSTMGAWRGCGWGAGVHVSRASGLVVAGRGRVGHVTVLSRVAVSVRRGLRARVGVRGARDARDARPGCARGHGAREGAFVYAATWAGRLCCKRLWTHRGCVRGTVVHR